MCKRVNTLIMVMIVSIIIIASVKVCLAGEWIEIGGESMWIIGRAYNGGVDVELIITDPQGHRIGYDPRTNQWLHEFSGSYEPPLVYDDTTGKDILVSEEGDKEYKTEAEFNLIPGNYTIEVIGRGLTEYNLFARVRREIKGYPDSYSKIDFYGVLDKDLSAKYKITYNPDPASEPGVGARITTPSSIKQDITLSRKIGWIDNDGIMKSLLSKTEAIDASIAKGNKEAAKNQLNAFINEVNAQKGKHISDKAVKVFLEDAQCIMENLLK